MIFYYIVGAVFFFAFLYFYLFYIKPKGTPLYKAKRALEEGNIDDAILYYEEHIKLHPNDAKIHYELYELYAKIGDEDKALFHLNEVIRIGKFDVSMPEDEIYKKAAVLSKKLGYYERAFYFLYTAYKKFPLDPFITRELGFMALGQKEFEVALKFLLEYEKVEKTDAKAYLGIAIAYSELGKTEDAIKYFDKALSLDPRNTSLILLSGIFYYFNKFYSKAVVALNQVIEEEPDDYLVFFARRMKGYSYIFMDNINKAVDAFEENLEFVKEKGLDKEEVTAHFDLSIGYIFLEDIEKADKHFHMGKMFSSELYQEIRKMLSDKDFSIEKFEIRMKFYKIIERLFPKDLMYKLSGFEAPYKIKIRDLMDAVDNVKKVDKDAIEEAKRKMKEQTADSKVDALKNMSRSELVAVVNKILDFLGYVPIKEMNTYMDRDGMDIMVHTKDDLQNRGIAQYRNWHNVQAGEIVISNLYSLIGENNLSYGIFITPSKVTEGAKKLVERYKGRIRIIEGEELNAILSQIRW